MISFLFTTLFGICFVFAVTLLIIGYMYLLRVCLILWFDVDFVEKIKGWFKNA